MKDDDIVFYDLGQDMSNALNGLVKDVPIYIETIFDKHDFLSQLEMMSSPPFGALYKNDDY